MYIKFRRIGLVFICQLSAYIAAAQEVKKDTLKRPELLKEVEIKRKNKITEIKESPINVEVIDVRKVHGQSGSLVDLINRSPGVKMRSDGYLGAPVNISLNGLDGKAIVLFKDGIPLSLFGHSFDPGLIPSNMLDRIEIYKGALPVSLGADALGGAINFVSRFPSNPLIDVSYEISSYNTHRSTLTGYSPLQKIGGYAGINTSFAYSDNDYTEERRYFDNSPMGYFERVKYLNNKTRSFTGEAYIGLRNRTWADDIRLMLVGSALYKQLPFIPLANPRKYALHAYSDENNITPMLRYDKKLFDNRLELNAVLAYSRLNTVFRDTSLNNYDRYGKLTSRTPYGRFVQRELSDYGHDMSLHYNLKTIRLNATYHLNSSHAVEFNHIYTSNRRIGTDTLGGIAALSQIDMYSVPATYQKNITAAGLHSWFLNRKLENIAAVKHYQMTTSGFSTYAREGGETQESSASKRWGWMEGLSYRFHERWLAKLSYEYATRLPDDEEVFGDAIKIQGNFSIKPESSHNYNLQLQYHSKQRGTGALAIMTNYFIRNTSQRIQLYRDLPFSYYLNQDLVKVQGMELDIQYRPLSFLSVAGNVTYQDVKNYKTVEYSYAESLKTPVYLGRLGNMPPLFANLQARFDFKNFLQKGSTTEVYWYYNYVHRFNTWNYDDRAAGAIGLFERFPDDYQQANRDFWLPHDGRMGQQNHNIGIMQRFSTPNASISLECHNLSNQQLFDNLYVEKPGRTFHLKLRWELNMTRSKTTPLLL